MAVSTRSDTRTWRTGELARASGLTVRTLRYYDRIGLLTPSSRSAAGHRLYGPDAVTRLYQIVALRRLGLSLAETREMLTGDLAGLRQVVASHRDLVSAEIDERMRLRAQLERVLHALDGTERVSPAEFLEVVATMTMLDQYLTPEQVAALRSQRAAMGDEAVRRLSQRRLDLIAELDSAHREGVPPADDRVQAAVRSLEGWFRDFIPDAGIAAALVRMVRDEGVERATAGAMSEDLARYVEAALAARSSELDDRQRPRSGGFDQGGSAGA
jgi:DNA-binding transcriptional MerR regulator